MSTFVYSAADQKGGITTGEREAEDPKSLARALKLQGLFLLEAHERRAAGSGSPIHLDLGELRYRIRRIRIVDKIVFTRNLAVMVGAGLSLSKALEALARQAPNPKFRRVIAEVNSSVVRGKSFAESLRGHEEIFGTLYINMIEAGETSGKLTLVLKLLTNQMKREYELRRRVKGAMMYPLIIVIALAGIGAMMMLYVVPTLIQTIQELNVELPLSTRLIIGFSTLLSHYGLFMLLGAMVLILGVWRILKTKKGKRISDRIILRMPVVGALAKEFNAARFCRTLAYLITSGVPIVRALEISSSVLGNSLFRDATHEASVEIQKGKQLHELLAAHGRIFDPLVVQMVEVGEETGKISDMLLRLALFFESDVNHATKNLSTIVEPVLMIVIGVVVGFFAISMFQPIYSSLGSIG